MISFNNIPNTVRTPGVFTEVDNSRALTGLAANPQKALIIGQLVDTDASVSVEELKAITNDGLADGYFGPGSVLARMCNTFKLANPNTELYAIALSNDGGVKASGAIQMSVALSATTGIVGTANEQYNLLINGTKVYTTLVSGWSVTDVNSAVVAKVNANSLLPVIASTNATSALNFMAVQSGTLGNFIDIRENYFVGESSPLAFGDSATITPMAGGSVDPDLGDAWTIIENDTYNYIVQPYIDATNLSSIEDELETRFGPLIDKGASGFTANVAALATITALGNGRNSPYNSIIGAYDSPTSPEEWAASLGAVAAFNLNEGPARPLHFLKLPGVLAPPAVNQFTQSERNVLLTDGVVTWITDQSGNVLIERCITTYQTNALGIPDASYLDIQTLATLIAIRFQFKARMTTRFMIPRFKLADDTFPVQPGTNVVTPKTIKAEIISLFSDLQTAGLIENLDEFIENLIVQRNTTDKNRVDCLLPPDLVNQFRVLAAKIQFIL